MVDVTYRTLGPWGSGKGANLQPSEVDSNFYSLAQAIVNIQDNPEEPNGIYSITVSGTQMTITLSDGTVLGPYTLPVLTFRWRGEYLAGSSYAVLDVFTVSTGNDWIADTSTVRYGIFMVQVELAAAPMFEPDLTIDGVPAFIQLFGSVDTLLSTLADVDVDEPPGFNPLAEGHALRWSTDSETWVNSYIGSMAVQDAHAVDITGGTITGLPPPVDPMDAVNKAYVDALPAGMTAPSPAVMANIVGYVNPAIPNTLSDILDACLGTTVRGTILHRSDIGWEALEPGFPGDFLQTHGPGVDVDWQPGGAGVTQVVAGAGITTGASAITSTGSVALAAVADNSLLANVSGSSVAPSATTLTVFLDHVLSNTRGSVLVRSGSGWVALAPGTVGYFLQTQGSTADPQWASPAGAGTVTSVSAGTGISTGGAPITGAGTVSLAPIATASVLANISGGSAAPIPATVSALFDSVFGATQGAVLYRSASAWVLLAPGTSGQVLTTGGASANPAWANAAAAAPIANLLLLANISGSTAAASGNTLSSIFDAVLGSSRGMLVYRGASGWTVLAPGTAGQLLQTGGTGGNPSWVTGAAGGSSITVSDTPPVASPGDAWWCGTDGQLYIRVDDGTSVQWAPASNQPGPAGATGADGPTGPTGPTGPAGAANMSGMTAGQIPIAATATTVTSSGNLSGDITSNSALVTALATVNANTGTFAVSTVNAKGLTTAAGNLTGDVTSAGAAATIANGAVTLAKMQSRSAATLLGNPTAGSAAPAEITLGTNLSFAGAVLNAAAGSSGLSGMTAGQIPIAATATTVTSSGNLSGDVVSNATLAATIQANAVTTAKINNAAVTYAKIQNVAANRLLGNSTGSAAAPAEIALPLGVSLGGTGSGTAAAALTALGAVAKAGDTMTGSLAVSWNGTGILPASATNGWAVGANYGTDLAADFWNTGNTGIGFNFRQKTGASAQRLVAQLYNDAGVSELDFYVAGSLSGGVGANAGAAFLYGPTAGNITLISNNNIALQTGTGVVVTNAAGTLPTGGAKGAGTLNATGVYANNTLLTSDADLKTDIEPLPAACLPLVTAVEPKSFRWREPDDDMAAGGPGDFSERRHSGFLAQDLADAEVPGIVEGKPGEGMAVDIGAMLATLWQAMRELSAEVAALKAAKQ